MKNSPYLDLPIPNKANHGHLTAILGKTILAATYDQTSAGYDFLLITFTDASQLIIREMSQSGQFHVFLAPAEPSP